jgi:tetratricopeptide (TPR) repeat protein
LDGWQAGALVVLLAASAVFLAVPRAAQPVAIPAPTIDRAVLAATMAADDELALRAEREVLDVDIRAVGQELRRYNRAVVEGHRSQATIARRDAVRATLRAVRRSEQELLALRAYQTRQFVAELARWQRSGEVSTELENLGGPFLQMARLSRWCTGNGRQLLPDEAVLRAFFKKRWNGITGAEQGPFALTLDEDRVRFDFLLRHPMAPSGASLPNDPISVQRQRLRDEKARLEIIATLGKRDPTYPATLARGIVHYRLGRFGDALQAFRQHLAVTPDGPYSLRAQNYFKAALDQSRAGFM